MVVYVLQMHATHNSEEDYVASYDNLFGRLEPTTGTRTSLAHLDTPLDLCRCKLSHSFGARPMRCSHNMPATAFRPFLTRS
eukprot:6735419-Pyramimonas_sp.AAC.1